MIKRCFSFIW